MLHFRRIAGAFGPWAVALGLHGAIAAAAALVFVGSSAVGFRPERPADGVYSVDLRPAGEASAVPEPARGDGRVYTSIEPDPGPVDGPIAEIPGLKIAPAPLEIGRAQGVPGHSSPHRGHVRLPSNSTEGEGRGSGTLGSGPGGSGTVCPIPPVVLESPAPRYPDSARRRNVEGAALVEISIRADGAVERGYIVKSSGNSELDEAAVEAVRRWRYRPATLSGKPIPSVQRVKFVFQLE